MSFQATALLLAWVAILVLALAMAGMLHQLRTLTAPASVPSSVGPQRGAVLALPLARADSAFEVVIFVDPECGTCDRLVEDLPVIAGRHADSASFVLATRAAASPTGGAATGVRVLANGGHLFDDLGIGITPFAVVTDGARRVVASRPVASGAAVDAIVTELLESRGGDRHVAG